jgi:hypothetical protein
MRRQRTRHRNMPLRNTLRFSTTLQRNTRRRLSTMLLHNSMQLRNMHRRSTMPRHSNMRRRLSTMPRRLSITPHRLRSTRLRSTSTINRTRRLLRNGRISRLHIRSLIPRRSITLRRILHHSLISNRKDTHKGKRIPHRTPRAVREANGGRNAP